MDFNADPAQRGLCGVFHRTHEGTGGKVVRQHQLFAGSVKVEGIEESHVGSRFYTFADRRKPGGAGLRALAIQAGLQATATADEAEAKQCKEGAGLDQFRAELLHVSLFANGNPVRCEPAAALES